MRSCVSQRDGEQFAKRDSAKPWAGGAKKEALRSVAWTLFNPALYLWWHAIAWLTSERPVLLFGPSPRRQAHCVLTECVTHSTAQHSTPRSLGSQWGGRRCGTKEKVLLLVMEESRWRPTAGRLMNERRISVPVHMKSHEATTEPRLCVRPLLIIDCQCAFVSQAKRPHPHPQDNVGLMSRADRYMSWTFTQYSFNPLQVMNRYEQISHECSTGFNTVFICQSEYVCVILCGKPHLEEERWTQRGSCIIKQTSSSGCGPYWIKINLQWI